MDDIKNKNYEIKENLKTEITTEKEENNYREMPERKDDKIEKKNNEFQPNKTSSSNGKSYYLVIIISILIIFISAYIALIKYVSENQNNIDENNNIKILEDEENEEEFFEEFYDDKILNKSYKVIISIDFGSSYSGYSVGYDENKIESKDEHTQPTTIVINKDNLRGYIYGKLAEEFMNQPISDKYIYFSRIKTLLDPDLLTENQSKIYINSTYPPNYQIKVGILIKEYLRMISDDALSYYNLKINGNYSKDDIKWILTVPAIWNEFGKQYMRKYAKKAGLNSVIIALEPEAASLTMFKDSVVEKEFKEQGKVFMLIDAGGYTLNVTINEIIDKNYNIKQLSPPSGGAYGSMKINDLLIKVIEETFTKEKIKEYKENDFDIWHSILDKLEETKKRNTIFYLRF